MELIRLTNKYLAGEQLVYNQLAPYFDEVIDDINAKLNSTFPSFTDIDLEVLSPGDVEYNYFPDKYLRSVVAIGAAYKFYVMDEEGISTAEQYGMKYQENLFYMMRDYIEQVPEEYQSDSKGSLVISIDNAAEPLPMWNRVWC